MATNFVIAMAEMEFAGLTFKGGKMLAVILTALGSSTWWWTVWRF